MKKIFIVIGLIILSVVSNMALAGYFFTVERKSNISKKIEIKVPVFSKMEETEEYWGFVRDGESLIKINYSKANAEEAIKQMEENSHWRKLPLTEELANYRCISNKISIPNVKNGYWFVQDRYYKATDKYDAESIFDKDRSALNFTLAIFDTDENILYVFSEDT